MATCVMCEETITNPVCPDCIHQGIRQWLLEQQELHLATEVQYVTMCDNSVHTADNVNCIKCHKNMAICTYCYSKNVFDVIKFKPYLIAEYMMFFSFDLEHMGWERDARNLIADY